MFVNSEQLKILRQLTFCKKSMIKTFCAYDVSKGTKSGYLGGRFLYTTENYQFWFNFNLLLTGKSAVTHPS